MLAFLAIVLSLSLSPQEHDSDPVGNALIACAPPTLDAAISCLDMHWGARDEFKALPYDEITGAHFGVGMWMRNNWGLWGGGSLAQYFNALGIRHPDDMSGIILKSYWLHLQDCPMRLEEQVGFYKAYWANKDGAAMPEEVNLDCTAQRGDIAR